MPDSQQRSEEESQLLKLFGLVPDFEPVACAGCGAACGAEELVLDDDGDFMMGVPPKTFRSWRCLIRHAIKQHALSSEPLPPGSVRQLRRPLCSYRERSRSRNLLSRHPRAIEPNAKPKAMPRRDHRPQWEDPNP